MTTQMSDIDKSKLAKLLLNKGMNKLAKKKDMVEDPYLDIKTDPASKYEPFELCYSQNVHLMGRSGFFDMTAGSNCYQSFVFKNADETFIDGIDAAFQKLIERHDALRIKMISPTEQQVLEVVPEFRCIRKDLRHLEPAEADERVRQEHKTLVFKPGDPFKWPLLDAVVLILKGNTLVLCWRMDLFIYDFPSRLVITDEFFKILKDPDIKLPDLNFRFRDYVKASLEAPNSLFYKKSKEYWERKISTFPEALQLPKARRISPGTQTTKNAFLSRLKATDWERIKKIANKISVTPSVVASVAFAHVLRKFSRYPHFFMGLISFNRFDMHKQADDILGCFVQVVPFIFDYEAETFAGYCLKSREQLVEAMQNRYYPGHLVLRDLHRIRKAGAQSLCPVMLTLLFEHKAKIETFPDNSEIGDVTSEITFEQLSLPQLQLHPGIGENPDGSFWCNWNHAAELYPEGLIKDMSECLTELLTLLAVSEDNWNKVSFESLCEPIVNAKESIGKLNFDMKDNLDTDEDLLSADSCAEMSGKIIELLKDEWAINVASVQDDLYDLGFTSMMLVKLLGLIRNKLGLSVPQEILLGSLTVEAFASRLCNANSRELLKQEA